MRHLIASALLALVAVAPGRELPPEAYIAMQKKAPEFLRIRVLDVKTRIAKLHDRTDTFVELSAKVEKVMRSATKLKPGQKIAIRYTVTEHTPPWAGPGLVPIPKKAARSVAYLAKARQGAYEPAAGRYTYETMKL